MPPRWPSGSIETERPVAQPSTPWTPCRGAFRGINLNQGQDFAGAMGELIDLLTPEIHWDLDQALPELRPAPPYRGAGCRLPRRPLPPPPRSVAHAPRRPTVVRRFPPFSGSTPSSPTCGTTHRRFPTTSGPERSAPTRERQAPCPPHPLRWPVKTRVGRTTEPAQVACPGPVYRSAEVTVAVLGRPPSIVVLASQCVVYKPGPLLTGVIGRSSVWSPVTYRKETPVTPAPV